MEDAERAVEVFLIGGGAPDIQALHTRLVEIVATLPKVEVAAPAAVEAGDEAAADPPTGVCNSSACGAADVAGGAEAASATTAVRTDPAAPTGTDAEPVAEPGTESTGHATETSAEEVVPAADADATPTEAAAAVPAADADATPTEAAAAEEATTTTDEEGPPVADASPPHAAATEPTADEAAAASSDPTAQAVPAAPDAAADA